MAPFVDYVKARFQDDPHLWASALFDEVVPLGYDRAYPSFGNVNPIWPQCDDQNWPHLWARHAAARHSRSR